MMSQSAISMSLWVVLVLSLAPAPGNGAEADRKTGPCPNSRVHIEPKLRTLPGDGEFYTRTRQAIRVKIDRLIRVMGGRRNTRAVAHATRAKALARIENGAKGAERRYHQDTVLRADALIAILDCLETSV